MCINLLSYNFAEFIYSNRFFGADFIVFYSIVLEKAMAPHSSTLAWKIPWTKEPGGLQSMAL